MRCLACDALLPSRGVIGHPLKLLASQVLEPDVRSGTSHHPRSKLRAVLPSLGRQWVHSRVKTMAEEFGNLPRRIATILRTSHLSFCLQLLPAFPWDHSLENPYPVSSLLLACNEGIQRLKTENSWSERLEAQMAAQAFQLAAR